MMAFLKKSWVAPNTPHLWFIQGHVRDSIQRAAEQRSYLSPGRVCEPWVMFAKNVVGAAERRHKSIELISVAAPQLQQILGNVTQGSQTRPGLTYKRRPAAR